GGLARAVGSDEAEPLAGAQLHGDAADDLRAVEGDAHVVRADGVGRVQGGGHGVALPRHRTKQKKGAPMKAVMTPTGSSAGATSVRAPMSTKVRKVAPRTADSGTTSR